MIQSVTIENFKSFERATLPLAPLTLLIGANASGKSNAIEAMQLLAWLASGQLPVNLLYAVREQELSLRGGFKDLAARNGEIKLGCKVRSPKRSPLTLLFGLENSDEGFQASHHLLLEEVGQDQHPLLESSSKGTLVLYPSKHDLFQSWSDEIRRELQSILFLEPEPRRMREYSFLQEKRLKRDGSALSSVLHHITEDEGKKAQILEIIRSLPEQDISDISYIETPRGEVMVQLHETFGGKAVPREAALLSDGTLRVLAVAAALFSVPEGSLVVIEEIDNGVHPSRAEALLSNIQKVAKERNVCVLLTTHNPALLDALPLDAVPDVVACYRDPQKGDSRLVRLEDLEGYPELVAQGPLGRLLTQGIVDRYLKSPEKRDRAKKTERDLAWIEEMRRQA